MKSIARTFFFFFLLFFIIVFSLSLLTIFHFLPLKVSQVRKNEPVILYTDWKDLPVLALKKTSPIGEPRNPKCTHYDCFNIYRCGQRDHIIQVYVYPLKTYINEKAEHVVPQMSLEYYKILKAIINSKYYSPNPDEACILVPSIDTLNQNKLKLKEVSQVLASLPQLVSFFFFFNFSTNF